ncbi:MAG: hypothetical protein RL748_77 [Pseudomonadota bacterium]|jgi:HSP20 family protein
MATATHYDAFDLLEHVFNRAQQPRCAPVRKEAAPAVETRLIRMDVTESEHAYTVLAELPGVKKEQLEVRIEGKQVWISGQILPANAANTVNAASQASSTDTNTTNTTNTTNAANNAANPAPAANSQRQLLNERFYGKLERRIQLPLDIDDTLAQAKFVDGILQLQLPKKQLPGARKLEIE